MTGGGTRGAGHGLKLRHPSSLVRGHRRSPRGSDAGNSGSPGAFAFRARYLSAAPVPTSPMSEVTLQLLLTIRRRLRTAMRRRTAADVAFGALVTVAVLGALLLAGAAMEAVLWMGVGLRSLFFWAF